MIEQLYKTTSDYPFVLTAKEIQQILGIGERQPYELLNPGQFHIVRVGKMIKSQKMYFLNGYRDKKKWCRLWHQFVFHSKHKHP